MEKSNTINDTWDLTKIFKSESEIKKNNNQIKKLLKEVETYKEKIESVAMKDALSFLSFIKLTEEISLLNERNYIYSYLYYYSNTLEEKGQKLIFNAEKINDLVTEKIAFIIPELLSIDYKKVKELLKDKCLKEYKHNLETLYREKKHILTKEEEELLSKLSAITGVGSDAYSKLDDTDISFENVVDSNGKIYPLNHSTYGTYMESQDRKLRETTFNSTFNYYKKHINTISTLYLSQIKEDNIFSKLRKYKSPIEASLFNDNINISLIDNLIKETNKNIPKLNEYYKLKEKLINVDKIHMYDLYVNPYNATKDKISFDEAKDIIFKALDNLPKDYLNKLEHLFNNRCIDKYHIEGKRSGAYEWGTYGIDPYVSLEYNYDINSVSTLIHELGHAMHTVYSNEAQTYTYAAYPIFLAEIASTVNETLLSDYLYKNAKTKEEKQYYLIEFLDKFKATVFRQVMFTEFEKDLHDKYQNNAEITRDTICNEYYNLNGKYYNAVENDEMIKYEWARIPHFYTPFYVYKYATGFLAAIIIVNRLNNDKEFAKKYIKFLSSGGSKYPLDILKDLGIDLTNINVLNEGFKIFNEKLKELEKISKE